MNLDNLVGISLENVTSDAAVIGRLLSAAKRNIADAHVREISAENRFDAAYKAIMQLANAALQANGFRTLTSKPGHPHDNDSDARPNCWGGQADGDCTRRIAQAA